MTDQFDLKILVLGYNCANITFLNRLVRGLTGAGCRVIMGTSHCKALKSSFENIDCLWLPPQKRWQPFKYLYLLYSFLSSLGTGRFYWLGNLVRQGDGFKNRLVIFLRYAPLCRVNFNLVYFPWNSTAITYQGLYRLGKPVVISCRGSQVNIRPHLPGQEDYAAGLKWTLENAAAVHCVSKDIRGEAGKYGFNEEKSFIIPPAVDPDFFIPQDKKESNRSCKLITTGSLIWRKGYEYLLLSLKSLITQGIDAELEILGIGPMQQNILFAIEDLGLGNRVHLHGRLAPHQVVAKLQIADVFVLASLSEGISNAVLEAMSCGLPIVTTETGGMREAVTDGVEGFVVSMREPEAMAGALAKLAADPHLRTSMGDAGRKRVLVDFRLDDQVNAFISMFKSVSEK